MESAVCPSTLEIRRDRVVAADGHTYEREALLRWLKGSRGMLADHHASHHCASLRADVAANVHAWQWIICCCLAAAILLNNVAAAGRQHHY